MKLRTQLLLGYLVVFVLLVGVVAVMYENNRLLFETQQWVMHTHQVIAKARMVERLVVDMQAGKRGYLITGSDAYLQPYDAGTEAYAKEAAALRDLISDDPQQLARLDEIDARVGDWQKTVAIPDIEKRREVKRGRAALAEVAVLMEKETGRNLMEQIRHKANEFVLAEENLLAAREKAAEANARRSVLVVVFGTLLAIAFGIGAMVYITRSIFRQVGGEPAEIAGIAAEIGRGNLDVHVAGDPKSATGIYASIGLMLQSLRENRDEVKRNTQSLQRLSSELETIIDSIPIPVFYKDIDGRYLGCNKAFSDFLGKPKNEIVGKTVHDMGPKEIADKYQEKDEELFNNPGRPQVYEWKVMTRDGELRCVIFSKSTFTDPEDNVAGLIGMISDITERVKAEEEIRNLAKFPQENPSPVLRIGQDGTVLYTNVAGKSLLKTFGCDIGRATPPEWRPWVAEAMGSPSPVQHELDHEGRIFSFAMAPVKEGGYVNWYGTDITDRKQAEEALRESERRLISAQYIAKIGDFTWDLQTG